MADSTLYVSVIDLDFVKHLVAQLTEIHVPVFEEGEVFYEAERGGPTPLCDADCTERTCPGHDITITTCRECGYAHDEYPIFRPWPCPTIQAVHEVLGHTSNEEDA